ncbi:MAG: hypothetical protein JEY99_21155 [Spirochaetales bacterium]|nr:hypothetical protein [Spirochaetales bacterium]
MRNNPVQSRIMALLAGLFFMAVLSLPMMAVEAEFPRISPSPFWLDASSWSEELSPDEIIMATLMASGVEENDLEKYTLRLENLIETLAESETFSDQSVGDYEKGELLLAWIHDNLLSRYSFHQTRMDVLLDSGENNCVSSSVLYLLMGKVIGLDVSAVETRDHVFCLVQTDEGPIDVETTTVWGFNPGIKKEFADEFNRTGFTYVPPGNYRYRKADSDKELIALILQNRMAALQREGRHGETVGLAVDKYTFLQNEQSRDEMNSAFKNWASELSGMNRDEEAYLFLARTSESNGLLEANNTVLYQLANNVVAPLINRGDHEEAAAFLTEKASNLSNDKFLLLDKMIKESRIEQQILEVPYGQAIELAREGVSEAILTASRWRELTLYLNQNMAIKIAEEKGWLEGTAFIEALPANEMSLRGMSTLRNNFKQNWTAATHNEFVDYYQAGKLLEARQILEEALQIDPENRYLRQDLRDLDRISQ